MKSHCKKIKGIHPEFLLSTKGDIVDQSINSMNIIDGRAAQEGDSLFKRVGGVDTFIPSDKLQKALKSKGVVQRLQSELDNYRYSQSMKLHPDNDTSTFDLKIKNLNNFVTAHKKKQAGVFRVSKEFFELVSNIRRSIPFTYIGGEDKPIYIKTPDLKINNVVYNGAYVFTFKDPLGYLVVVMTPKDNYTIMGCGSVLLGSPDGTLDLDGRFNRVVDQISREDIENGNIFTHGDDQTTIHSDIRFTPEDTMGGRTAQRKEKDLFDTWLVGLINTAVYVHSQDPNIDELKPLRMYQRKELAKLDKSVKENLCTLPVKLVNWEYHTGRTFSCGEVSVQSHMRWQPCGIGRSEVKLIFVKEHTRNYGKNNE